MAEEPDRANSITKRVNKILEFRVENDKETLNALKDLSEYFPQNSIQNRRNLRSNIEKRSLAINEDFLQAFRKVKENLDVIYSDVYEMNTAVVNMTSQLNATRNQTHQLIEQTTKLQSENEKLTMQEDIANSFIKTFQLSPSELTSLKDQNVDEDFFLVLEKVNNINNSCKQLMQCGHQTSAITIMDQMAHYQETGMEKLYRWSQTHCKNIESPAISQILTKAMSILQHRMVLFKHVVNEYCTHRRSVLVRVFLDALTKGGPGGTPKPIEVIAHDPPRYVSDMLAFLHQAIPSEHENLMVFLKGCDQLDITEEVQEAMANISEGVCVPLRVRVEHILTTEIPLKSIYSITNLLAFYRQTFLQEVGENGGLIQCLKELEDMVGDTLLGRMSSVVRKEVVERVSVPPSDLSPSPGVEALLSLLRDIFSMRNIHNTQPALMDKIIACVLDPLLQAVNLSASGLATTDMSVYVLNCLHQMQTTLALYEFMDDRLERIKVQCDAHLDTLTSEQASSLVANLNLGPIYAILQDFGSVPLSQVPGMQPSILNNFVSKFESFVSMPELLLLPQVNCLLSASHRSVVLKRSTDVILAIYNQLYTAVHDPSNAYDNPEHLMPRTPQQASEMLQGPKHPPHQLQVV